MSQASVDFVQTYIQDRYLALEHSSASAASGVNFSPVLDPEEAADFLAGCNYGLFEIDDQGYAQSVLLPNSSNSDSRQKLIQLFWRRNGGERFLYREGVCQLAAASALVLKYGWPKNRVRLEPNKEDLGGHAYGVDLIVSGKPGGPAIIFGEVKKDQRELAKLLRELFACGAMGPHDKTDCNHLQHKKFATCWSGRPKYFWAVCPGQRKAFELIFKPDSVEFIEIDDIPAMHNS